MIIPAILIAVLSAVGSIIHKIICEKISGETVLIMTTIINIIVMSLYSSYHTDKLSVDYHKINYNLILLLLFMTIGCTLFANILYTKLLEKNKTPYKIGLITSLSPLISMYFSHIIFNNKLNKKSIIGSLIVVLGISLIITEF